jgi:hypothetical protein
MINPLSLVKSSSITIAACLLLAAIYFYKDHQVNKLTAQVAVLQQEKKAALEHEAMLKLQQDKRIQEAAKQSAEAQKRADYISNQDVSKECDKAKEWAIATLNS